MEPMSKEMNDTIDKHRQPGPLVVEFVPARKR
jgi:hypothetical protein